MDIPNLRRTPWWKRFHGCIFYPAVVLVLAACILFVPCIEQVRDGEGWTRSANSIKTIGIAIHNYHGVYGHLPPVVVTDKNEKPLYSWRVALLPFLEENALYNKFKLDEPWDSLQNKEFLAKTPRCYVPIGGGNDQPGLTRYQVFVGPGTAFERPGLRWSDLPDDPSNIALVAEAAHPVPWTKPEDLVYDPDGPLPALGGQYRKPVHFLCHELWRTPGFNVCFADGTSRFIPSSIDEQALRALISRSR